MYTPELFQRLFPNATEYPPYFSGTCCSQFALSRQQIRSRPRETYERLLDWVLEYQWDDRSGMFLEFLWPYLFTGRSSMCPSMEDCYCKTYNFCMRNPADVESLGHWNNIRTRREEVKWQLTFMENALEKSQEEHKERGGTPKEVVDIELKFRPELDRLTYDLEVLTNNTWEYREKIVHRWNLPVPPTGW